MSDNYRRTFVDITVGGTNWVIGCLYYSPSASEVFVEECCDTAYSGLKHAILVGVLNLHYYRDYFYVNKLKNIFLFCI